MNPHWIVTNPDAIDLLPEPAPSDPHVALEAPVDNHRSASHRVRPPNPVALEVHSYNPFGFCGGDGGRPPRVHSWPVGAVEDWATQLHAWAERRNVSILLGEFGCTRRQSNASGRLAWYAASATAVARHGFAATVWDDSGDFAVWVRVRIATCVA